MPFGNRKRKATPRIRIKFPKKIEGKDENHHMALKKQIASGAPSI